MSRMIAAAFAVALWVAPAWAQSPALTQLQQAVDAIVDAVESLSQGSVTLETAGDIEYVERDGGAEALLRDAALVEQSGPRVTLGTLRVTARPAASGAMDYAVALPTAIRGADGTGQETFSLTLAAGALAARWNDADGRLEALSLALEGVAFRQPPGPLSDGLADLGRLALGFALRPAAQAPGAHGLDFEAAAEGLSVAERAGSPPLFVAERMRWAGTMDGFTLEALDRFLGEVAAAFAQPPAQIEAALGAALHAFWPPHAHNAIEVRGLRFTGGELPRLELADRLRTDAGGETLGYMLRYLHEGLALGPGVVPFDAYIPASAGLDLALERLPAAEFRQLLLGPRADPPALALLAAAPRTGAILRLATLGYDSATFGLALRGEIAARATAPLLAVGEFDLTLRGLEQVLRDTGADAVAGAAVSILQGIGQQATDGAGRPVRTYRIELTPQGGVLVNGTDVMPLISGGPPPAPPRR